MAEPVAHNDMWVAYKRWGAFCEAQFGCATAEQAPIFEHFLGDCFSWHAVVIWVSPEAAEKVRWLNGPHHYALLKAWYYNETSMEASQKNPPHRP